MDNRYSMEEKGATGHVKLFISPQGKLFIPSQPRLLNLICWLRKGRKTESPNAGASMAGSVWNIQTSLGAQRIWHGRSLQESAMLRDQDSVAESICAGLMNSSSQTTARTNHWSDAGAQAKHREGAAQEKGCISTAKGTKRCKIEILKAAVLKEPIVLFSRYRFSVPILTKDFVLVLINRTNQQLLLGHFRLIFLRPLELVSSINSRGKTVRFRHYFVRKKILFASWSKINEDQLTAQIFHGAHKCGLTWQYITSLGWADGFARFDGIARLHTELLFFNDGV
jgi:hypothetical protein